MPDVFTVFLNNNDDDDDDDDDELDFRNLESKCTAYIRYKASR